MQDWTKRVIKKSWSGKMSLSAMRYRGLTSMAIKRMVGSMLDGLVHVVGGCLPIMKMIVSCCQYQMVSCYRYNMAFYLLVSMSSQCCTEIKTGITSRQMERLAGTGTWNRHRAGIASSLCALHGTDFLWNIETLPLMESPPIVRTPLSTLNSNL